MAPWQAFLLMLLAGACCARRWQGWLYLLQLDEYQPRRLARTARRRLRVTWPWQLALLLGGAVLAVATWRSGVYPALVLILACLLPLATDRPFSRRGSLRRTARTRRLEAASAPLALGCLWLLLWLGWPGAVALGLADALALLALLAALALTAPYELLGRRAYMRQAEARLAAGQPTVIGVTGSYGKTTTKLYLHHLLEAPGSPSFATPESFNTTLGVCRAINEGLRPEHRTAVVEMGAYRPGEIAEICSFTHPQVGVVTAVGVMHLERFGSRERIARAKSELLAALPEDGVAVLPSAIAERETLTAPLRARAVWVGQPGDRWWLEGLEVDADGSRFQLHGSGGEAAAVRAPVHGRHAVTDLLLALAAAFELGVSLERLLERCQGLEAAPHRLQVSRANGLTIIDDSYNSNPDGAAEALQLLGSLPGERRVLVTPGYIELGPLQEREMREFGRQAATVCSHVILVGRRQSAALAEGLREAGYPQGQVSVVASLEQAQGRLPAVAGPGSVVLFENDLPDSFLETA